MAKKSEKPALPTLLGGPRIERFSTVEQIASVLRRNLLEGVIRPGTPVPEQRVADELGVSRNSVREATRLLIPEGLLRHHMHRGVIVTEVDSEDVAEIYQIRRIIEREAVEVAVGLGPSVLTGLTEAAAGMRTAAELGDEQAVLDSDVAFHRALVLLLDNRRIQAFHAALQSEIRLGMWLVTSVLDDLDQLASQHEDLLRLLLEGRRQECLSAVDHHMDDSRSRLTNLLSDAERRATHPREG